MRDHEGAKVAGTPRRRQRRLMSTDVHSEHADHDHQHGADCGHEAVQHGDHVDYIHDSHRHAVHDDHYDEHESDAQEAVADHRS
jgi:hypothetical protein